MSTIPRMSAALAALICAAGLARVHAATPSRPALARAVRNYLETHGDLCVGKFTWPRYVTQADRRARTDDAVQLPVMERLGLVESQVLRVTIPARATPVSAPAGRRFSTQRVTRYSLTAKGREFYLHKKRTVLGAHERPVERDADICVGRLTLDKVVKWTSPARAHGHLESVVWYTYRIKSAKWMADPLARKVFPVVATIIRDQGNLLMTATVQARNGTWVPVLPGQ